MYNHEPDGYICPFCLFISGQESVYNKRSDIVFENASVIAFISPRWWVNNPGNVLVIPRKHIEHIYDIDPTTLAEVNVTGKAIAVAMKDAYKCDGTLFRQHNEPGGSQEVWHFHLHVFPRYTNDEFYQNHDRYRTVNEAERLPYAEKLRSSLTKITPT